jgi:hypothetical protein
LALRNVFGDINQFSDKHFRKKWQRRQTFGEFQRHVTKLGCRACSKRRVPFSSFLFPEVIKGKK